MKLSGKTILITGASSGLGKAMALRAAKDGATVIISARSVEKLNEVAKEITALGGIPVVIAADVTNVSDIRNLFLKATDGGRIIHAVFDNAGLGHIGRIQELTADQIQQMITVNTTGMILVAKYACEVFTRQKYGHLIMTSSLAGLISLPQWSVYVASKWAITGFADSIRYEMNDYGVKVTTLHPGAVNTGFFDKDKANIDIAKMGGDAIEPSVVADAVYDALFTNQQKIMVPAMSKNYALLYRYLPGIVQKLIEKQAKNIEYHSNIVEDEPAFSYIHSISEDKES